jgi:hypothetical protein
MRRFLFFLLMLTLSPFSLAAKERVADSPLPTITAGRIKSALKIDGYLSEKEWEKAGVFSNFLQREPEEYSPPTEKTSVRVVYNKDFLYFGIICYDSEPEDIVATDMQRDSDIEYDDHIIILLDTFHDKRNAYIFAVNPAGARTDGLVVNNSEDINKDWDGIWYGVARITEEGWLAEIAIPFKTLSFDPGISTWGLNIERNIERKQEKDRFASPGLDVYFASVAKAGELKGLSEIAQGIGLDVRPYFVVGNKREEDAGYSNTLDKNAGVDVFYNLAANLKSCTTINTDFAETEVDTRQINLTRFPLFFPEKRAFFLEGSGVFEFGNLRQDLIPFFSRRIGLTEEGEEIPIAGGEKITGRVGNYNLGFLAIRTRGKGDVDPKTLLVSRVSRNIFGESIVGFIYTQGDPTGTAMNRLFGIDFKYGTSHFRGDKNLIISGYFLRSFTEGFSGNQHSAGFIIDYPNDLFDIKLEAKELGDGFNPALGFVPRIGIRRYHSHFSYRPRPRTLGIRQLSFGIYLDVDYALSGTLLSRDISIAPFDCRTESGENLEFSITPRYEYLDLPFEIHKGIVIPVGAYSFRRYEVELHTANKRSLILDLEFSFGAFYSGDRTELATELTFCPNPHLYLSLSLEQNNVNLKEGSFVTRIIGSRFNYCFSPNVSWTNYVQYDNITKELGINSRFRYIFHDGNEFFIVFNQGWQGEFDRYLPRYQKGTFKFNYTFRF